MIHTNSFTFINYPRLAQFAHNDRRQSKTDPLIVRQPPQGPPFYRSDGLALAVLDSGGILHTISWQMLANGKFDLVDSQCTTTAADSNGSGGGDQSINDALLFADRGKK